MRKKSLPEIKIADLLTRQLVPIIIMEILRAALPHLFPAFIPFDFRMQALHSIL